VIAIGGLMRRHIAVVPPAAPIRQVAEAMAEADVDGALVVDGRGRVVGSIADEQLVAALHSGRNRSWWRQIVDDKGSWTDGRLASLIAADVMLRRVVVAPPGLSVTLAIRLFDDYAANLLPVIDHGVLVGALFRSDLVRRLVLQNPSGRSAGTSPVG
jgi:CBS domain-containing protein